MDINKTNQAVSPEGIRQERMRTIRVNVILALVIVSLIIATNVYMVSLLQLSSLVRRGMIISLAAEVIFLLPILLAIGTRLGRPAIIFGRIISSGRQPTDEEALEAVQKITLFPMHLSIMVVAGFLTASFIMIAVLHFRYNLPRWELTAMAITESVVAMNLGVVMYYAAKRLERHWIEMAANFLFAAGKFDFKHTRISLRTKLMVVFFMVVAYILVSSVLMGYAQVERVQRAQLEENLLSIAQQNTEQKGGTSGKSGIFMLDKSGELATGENQNITPDDIKYMLAANQGGIILDEKTHKMIAFSVGQDKMITGAIGFWGQTTGARSRTWTLLAELMFATILLCLVATFLVVNDIDMPLQRTVEYLERIWRGDDIRSLEAYSDDEMGMLVSKVTRTTQALKDRTAKSELMLIAVRDAIDLVTETTGNLAAISIDQATGTVEQATIVQEVVGTTGEIAATASNIADAATSVNSAAEETSIVCHKGEEYIASAIAGMTHIQAQVERVSKRIVDLSQQAQQIGDVVQIIEEISDHTGLLALNAAIEAAGAGDAGRRFDVVATEVRRLAYRSLEFTNAIKKTVENVQNSIATMVMMNEDQQKASDQGTKSVEQMREYFGTILKMVETTRRSASEIGLITKQQATASDQLANSIRSVEEVARELAKGGKNIESLVANLKALSDNLQGQIAEKES